LGWKYLLSFSFLFPFFFHVSLFFFLSSHLLPSSFLYHLWKCNVHKGENVCLCVAAIRVFLPTFCERRKKDRVSKRNRKEIEKQDWERKR
jgi:hypothetical protein